MAPSAGAIMCYMTRQTTKKLKLTPLTQLQLLEYADEEGVSVSHVVRQILADYARGKIATPPPRSRAERVEVRFLPGKRHEEAKARAIREGTSITRVIEHTLANIHQTRP